MISRLCDVCGNEFKYYPYEVNRKYCSLKCKGASNDVKEKLRIANTGKRASDEARKNMSIAHIGKNLGKDSPTWKGDNITYMPLHNWVREEFGRPSKCEHCKTTKPGRYEWANKSGDYKRDRNDWLRLCKKCHHKYDNIGETASATYIERKNAGEYELRDVGNGLRRWCKKLKSVAA